MNKRVFPSEQQSQLALGMSPVQQQSAVCGQRGYAGPSVPGGSTSKQSAVADSRGLVSDMKHRAAFCDVWLRLEISLDLLSC